MERAEVKEYLKKLGVKPEFVEMPAIVEPIYKDLIDKTVSEIESKVKITVTPDGNFTIGDRSIVASEDGGAKVSYSDVTIDVNEAGIAVGYSDGSWMDFFSDTHRKDNGLVEHSSGNNGNATMSTTVGFDNGSWSILNAMGAKFTIQSAISSKEEKVEGIDKEAVIKEFDENSQAVMRNYPGTIGWYTQKREALVATLDRECDPKVVEQRRIESLESEVKRLTEENGRLTQSNKRLTEMLEKALEFMSSVRNSPIGSFFFGKKIKNYENGLNKLDSGKQER